MSTLAAFCAHIPQNERDYRDEQNELHLAIIARDEDFRARQTPEQPKPTMPRDWRAD